MSIISYVRCISIREDEIIEQWGVLPVSRVSIDTWYSTKIGQTYFMSIISYVRCISIREDEIIGQWGVLPVSRVPIDT